MSLGIKKHCPYCDYACKHCRNWEVDDVDEYGRHVISREYECANENECEKDVK